MTDAEIDKLDGLELRKAVCDAVGWEWDPTMGWGRQKMPDGTLRYRMCMDWNDAIAACEAAVVLVAGRQITIGEGFVCIEHWDSGQWRRIGDAVGMTHRSLLRALLKVVKGRWK